tara:strand:+ start:107 stop:250 length:144 start_codon:yes stop_codon:yes gene_type:complete
LVLLGFLFDFFGGLPRFEPYVPFPLGIVLCSVSIVISIVEARAFEYK